MTVTDSETMRARRALVSRLLIAIAEGFVAERPSGAAYVVGSASYNAAADNRDLDILFAYPYRDDVVHHSELQYLAECLRGGDPFEGAFDAADDTIRTALADAILSSAVGYPSIRVQTSFAFGPAQNEINIPANGLHVHLCGPLTKGDFGIVQSLLPFHAREFREHHTTLIGPPLSYLISSTAPQLADLLYWDQIILRRFTMSPNDNARRKWVTRMVRNRTMIPRYVAKHDVLIRRCMSTLETEAHDELQEMVRTLIASAIEMLPPEPRSH